MQNRRQKTNLLRPSIATAGISSRIESRKTSKFGRKLNQLLMKFFKDISLPAFTAGFVAVLVGFTSSVAIVFQAALAFKATPEQLTSWMCISLSFYSLVFKIYFYRTVAQKGQLRLPPRPKRLSQHRLSPRRTASPRK